MQSPPPVPPARSCESNRAYPKAPRGAQGAPRPGMGRRRSAPEEDAAATLAQRQRFAGAGSGRSGERDEAAEADAIAHAHHRPAVALEHALVVLYPAPLDAGQELRALALEGCGIG